MPEVINNVSFPVVFNGQLYAKALNALHGFLEYPNSILLIYSKLQEGRYPPRRASSVWRPKALLFLSWDRGEVQGKANCL